MTVVLTLTPDASPHARWCMSRGCKRHTANASLPFSNLSCKLTQSCCHELLQYSLEMEHIQQKASPTRRPY